MSYYQHHIFFCTNVRQNGKKCCSQGGSVKMHAYAKERLKKMGIHGKSHIRTSTSGCMGRCQDGPALVIYPDNVWYTYHSQEDIDEIIDSHLGKGVQVKRLLIIDI